MEDRCWLAHTVLCLYRKYSVLSVGSSSKMSTSTSYRVNNVLDNTQQKKVQLNEFDKRIWHDFLESSGFYSSNSRMEWFFFFEFATVKTYETTFGSHCVGKFYVSSYKQIKFLNLKMVRMTCCRYCFAALERELHLSSCIINSHFLLLLDKKKIIMEMNYFSGHHKEKKKQQKKPPTTAWWSHVWSQLQNIFWTFLISLYTFNHT